MPTYTVKMRKNLNSFEQTFEADNDKQAVIIANENFGGPGWKIYSLFEIREVAFKIPAKVEDRVTDKMRQAAINYWKSIHPEEELIPIGEINGIIYAALEAEIYEAFEAESK